MLTETIQKSDIEAAEARGCHFLPKLENGKTIWVKLTDEDLVRKMAKEEEQGLKTYSTEEVRQKLEKRFGFRVGHAYEV